MPRPSLYRWTVALLAVTGIGQMPIFKRYYVADVPGLAWTADFILTHRLHYLGAAVLLFWLARRLSSRIPVGGTRLAILAVLALTGLARVFKNMPDASLAPTAVMLIDWTHLGAAMALGIAALATKLRRAPARAQTGRRV